jgi:hypothetical protein
VLKTTALTRVPEALKDDHPVAVFRRVFTTLAPDREMPLDELYTPDIQFQDPLHRLEGLEQVRQYFARLNAGLVLGQFSFGEALIGETAAMMPWTMHLTLRRLKRPIIVDGCSHLRFQQKVTHHRDYFDVGALVYEQIPLLGPIVRRIKAAL